MLRTIVEISRDGEFVLELSIPSHDPFEDRAAPSEKALRLYVNARYRHVAGKLVQRGEGYAYAHIKGCDLIAKVIRIDGESDPAEMIPTDEPSAFVG